VRKLTGKENEMPNEVADKVAEAIETNNLHRVLVNVNDLRKARMPGDVRDLKRRIAHLEKLLAEAQGYQARNENALALAEEEIRRASGLSGLEGIQKLKRIIPKRDKVRDKAGAWKAVAAEAADVLRKYREGLEAALAGRNVATFAYPTKAQAAAVAVAKKVSKMIIPGMPWMPHR
jgi:ABC-type transporter Mla subunit MlaD